MHCKNRDCRCAAVLKISVFTLNLIRETYPDMNEKEVKFATQELIQLTGETLKRELYNPQTPKVKHLRNSSRVKSVSTPSPAKYKPQKVPRVSAITSNETKQEMVSNNPKAVVIITRKSASAEDSGETFNTPVAPKGNKGPFSKRNTIMKSKNREEYHSTVNMSVRKDRKVCWERRRMEVVEVLNEDDLHLPKSEILGLFPEMSDNVGSLKNDLGSMENILKRLKQSTPLTYVPF